MIALNFIDKDLLTLNGEETVKAALDLLKRMELQELPLVVGNYYKGMVALQDLTGISNQEILVKQIELLTTENVDQHCHFFEIWSRLMQLHLSCIAVTSENREYLGTIRLSTLMQFYKQSFALTEPGSIIVISMRKLDYSLAKIASIVEEQDTVILSSFVTETTDPENILITIKLNRTEAQSIIQSLQRYDMDIIDVFSEESFSDIMKERFNMLMSYLNI